MTDNDSNPLRHQSTALERSIDGRVVVYNPATDEVHALDVVGSIVWRLLDEPCAISDLVVTLSEQFGEDPDRIRGDIEPLLDQLVAAGLIEAMEPTG